MAKRKRLTPPDFAAGSGPLETKAFPNGWVGYARPRAPVADVAGAAAATAALEELSDDIARLRAGGRLVMEIATDRVDETHLVRDRVAMEPEELDTLMASLAERGQQTPLDVVDLGEARYGLISGWRRLTALRRLHAETGEDRFARALCVLRRPGDSAEAYRAMVEENEIRAGLSFYEKARIAARAAGQGAYADTRAALRGLYGAVSKSKRSKIGSFIALHDHLDAVLEHPAQIPERLGLALAAALEGTPGFAADLRAALDAEPGRGPERERALLEAALRAEARKGRDGAGVPERQEIAPGIFLEGRGQRVVLTGPGVDDDLRTALAGWLAGRR